MAMNLSRYQIEKCEDGKFGLFRGRTPDTPGLMICQFWSFGEGEDEAAVRELVVRALNAYADSGLCKKRLSELEESHLAHRHFTMEKTGFGIVSLTETITDDAVVDEPLAFELCRMHNWDAYGQISRERILTALECYSNLVHCRERLRVLTEQEWYTRL